MKKNKRKVRYLILILLLLFISIGYAYLNSTLNITGASTINNPTWDIHWENVEVKTGSVSASTPTIDSSKTTVNYTVELTTPGDFYEFTVDAVNAGSIDGMVSVVTSKMNGTEITTLPNYLEYSVSYYDGVSIAPNHLLAANTLEKYKVHVGYKKDIDQSDMPTTQQTLNFSFSVTYVQSDDNVEAKPSPPESFSTDSWDTIVTAVKFGNISAYNVGDTKTVDMGTLGTHILRIANKSTPTECSTTGFSQTACGFVLEFADIITTHNMNSTKTNVGGWPASEMRTYVNTDIYNALPTELKNGIIDTTVVSGHGSTAGETNFTSTDKLYLLSTHEVWEDVDGNTSGGIDYYDTAYNNTRQLDYYTDLVVTIGAYNGSTASYDGNYSVTIKQRNGSSSLWWMRAASSTDTNYFYTVGYSGSWTRNVANDTGGVSPAFRIA